MLAVAARALVALHVRECPLDRGWHEHSHHYLVQDLAPYITGHDIQDRARLMKEVSSELRARMQLDLPGLP